MSMFDNYNNLPNNYLPNNTNQKLVDNRLPRKPLAEYNVYNQLVGYSWSYGDSVILEFTTSGTVVDDKKDVYMTAEEYLKGKHYKLEILNFKFNVIYTKVQLAEKTTTFIISKEDSAEYLTRGTYSCRLTLVDNENNEVVLFNYDNGNLYVK